MDGSLCGGTSDGGGESIMHRIQYRTPLCVALIGLAGVLCGCQTGPSIVPYDQQKAIDRNIVEYPPNMELTIFGRGFTAPDAIAFDYDEGPHKGTMFVAESGRGGHPARIYGFKPDGTEFELYPKGRLAQLAQLPPIQKLPFDIGRGPFELDSIGGMVVSGGKIFVTHRDRDGRGRLTAFNYDGTHFTVEGDFPAEGDYGMTDVVVRPSDGRIFFGLGSMTNSGVVGLDNFQVGWVKEHPLACDLPFGKLRLLGLRFDTRNPLAGLFGPDDTAVTGPFQAFNHSNQTRIPAAPNGKPTGAIYSVSPGGGDLQVEATGLHNPRGLAFDAYTLYFTDDGMEMRGTRPVKDDPDALFKLVRGTWYGFPDFSRNLYPIGGSSPSFQPPPEMIIVSGYPELAPVLNLPESGLISPEYARDTLLRATFPSLSGAARMDIVPSDGPFHDYRGDAIIALGGDRAPFATSGAKLNGPVGYKVVRVDPDVNNGPVYDFVNNTRGLPAHLLGHGSDNALERPVDVKIGPDGAMYILDFGLMRVENGKEKIPNGSGRIFRLGSPIVPTTKAAEPEMSQ
jgi:glucose/arabinose dehydrogenase